MPIEKKELGALAVLMGVHEGLTIGVNAIRDRKPTILGVDTGAFINLGLGGIGTLALAMAPEDVLTPPWKDAAYLLVAGRFMKGVADLVEKHVLSPQRASQRVFVAPYVPQATVTPVSASCCSPVSQTVTRSARSTAVQVI
jgi:hypothetical protein